MTQSQIFTAAHKLAKTYEGNYSACLSLALREVYESLNSNSMDAKKLADYIAQNDSGYNAEQIFVDFVKENMSKLSEFFLSENEIKNSDLWDSVFDITDEILEA